VRGIQFDGGAAGQRDEKAPSPQAGSSIAAMVAVHGAPSTGDIFRDTVPIVGDGDIKGNPGA
jgi:hypothetical protein